MGRPGHGGTFFRVLRRCLNLFSLVFALVAFRFERSIGQSFLSLADVLDIFMRSSSSACSREKRSGSLILFCLDMQPARGHRTQLLQVVWVGGRLRV